VRPNGPADGAQRVVLAIAILIVAALSFSKAFSSDYVSWDDEGLILNNVYVTAPFSAAVRGVTTHAFEGDYFPIPMLSYWLDVKLWGFDPVPQHAVNWLLHLGNICLLSFWLYRIGTTIELTAAITTAFALHPIQTEVVLWISERRGLLSSFFLLLGLLAFDRATQRGRHPRRWTAMWTICFALSCLCKVTGILLPFCLIAYLRFFEGKTWRAAVLSNIGAAIVAVGFAGLRYLTYAAWVGGVNAETLNVGHWLTLPFVIPTAIGHYLISLVFPARLSIIYPPFGETPHLWIKFAAGTAYLTLVAYSFVRTRGRLEILFGMWSLVLLLPVLNVIPRLNFVNDRYMYLPIIGVVGFFGSIAERATLTVPSTIRKAAFAGVALCLAYLGFVQSRIWQDSYHLWTDTVQRAPNSQLAWNNLGVVQFRNHQLREAEQSFRKAADSVPLQYILPLVNLAGLYLDPGQPTFFDPPRAYQLLTAGLQVAHTSQEQFVLRFNLGIALLRMDRPGAAVDTLQLLLADIEKASSRGVHSNLEIQVRDALAHARG